MTSTPRSRRVPPRLYLITDADSALDMAAATRAALSSLPAGFAAVQLRRPSLGAGALLEEARALLTICREAGALLLINDRADVALASGADGAHLPERGLSVADARALLGPDAIIARSCHDAVGLERAGVEGADFATLGPLGHVPGKRPPLTLDAFAALVAGAALPIVALGGVDRDLAPRALAAGAAGVAVIRAVLGASDPAAGARALLRALDAHPRTTT